MTTPMSNDEQLQLQEYKNRVNAVQTLAELDQVLQGIAEAEHFEFAQQPAKKASKS